MTEQPLVCICIPTFNAELTIRDTLLSILSQSYCNFVVHISDNASTDNTIKVIEGVADSRVHIHRQVYNVGGEENFNNCIRLAEGKYTAIFHADDIYESEMVECQVAFLERHVQAGAVFTEASLIDECGKKYGAIKFPDGLGSYHKLYDFEMIFKAVLRHSNFLICPSVMARTCVYKKYIQSWRGDLFKSSADLDVWLRISCKYPIGMLPAQLMRYRVGSNQFSAKVRVQIERADFFLVTEYYLEQRSVRKILNGIDIANYACLDRRDRVMRAVNCFLNGRFEDSQNLLYDACSWQAWKAGMLSKRGFGVLVAGVYLKLLLILRLEATGRLTLVFLRRIMRK